MFYGRIDLRAVAGEQINHYHPMIHLNW